MECVRHELQPEDLLSDCWELFLRCLARYDREKSALISWMHLDWRASVRYQLLRNEASTPIPEHYEHPTTTHHESFRWDRVARYLASRDPRFATIYSSIDQA